MKKMKLVSLMMAFSVSIALAGLNMPKEIESEFSQYPGSTVFHTIASEGMVQAILNCGNTPMDTVFEYYKKKISASDWKVMMEVKNPDVYQLMLQKNGKNGMIAVTREDDETSVVLSVGP